MVKRLYCFDFDGTLCHTTLPEEGKIIWKNKKGEEWPYVGWWSKAETLDPDVFYTPINQWVYREYLNAISEESSHVILATGRLEKVPNMRENIEKILHQHNVTFDDIYLTKRGDTFSFKTNLFENLIKNIKPEEFIMYDDRHEHIIRFYDWAEEQECKITIINVVSKKVKKFNY